MPGVQISRASSDVVAAIDVDALACRTYSSNHASTRVFVEDITTFNPRRMLKEVPYSKNVDLMVVCAPCQPFSNQNRHKGNDERANLILQAARFAKVLKPSGILFENVPGIGSAGVLESLRMALEKVGYHVGRPLRVNAADLGVPQRRIRCVMFAARSAAAVRRFEEADFALGSKTVADAIGQLRPLASGEHDPVDPLHRARTHSAVALRRLSAIPRNGGSRDALPEELQLACHKDRRGYPDVYGRMGWDDVAPTLTTGCTDITRGRFAHPEQDRAITLREAALLQSFPPDYVFHGNGSQIATQIGNAVPVAMVRAMVPTIVGALTMKTPSRQRRSEMESRP
ncbi:DNA cytosine methyltransferase [Bosea sp. R86505]|uniref:DNA cytosine methyltransferase n=1 Tax=Bosea sp. R86505 TaxID=3101710 RepID=UPI00366F1262